VIKITEQVLDLYSGPGGSSTGFGKYFTVIDAVDYCADACATYQQNHLETHIHNCDVADYLFSCIPKDFEGILFNGVIGSPPCCEFSRLNQQKNYLSKRAQQLFVMAAAIIQLKPQFALIENVATMPTEFKQRVIKQLIAADYKVQAKVVNANYYGSVQTRRRWILTACKTKAIFPAPKPEKIRLAKEILTDEISEMQMADSIKEGIRDLPIGKWVALPGQPWRGYYIVNPNKPLSAVINIMKNRLIKPDRSGYLSFNECKMAQGFPINYQFFGGITSRAQQLANAVPVELAECFAKAFFNILHPGKDLLDYYAV
jgi:DNA (cytosine-5)-methyltransferase 1